MNTFGNKDRIRSGSVFSSRWRQRTESGQGLYRSRDGVLLGVCKGLARYFDLSLGALRTIVVILFLITGIWPVTLLYLIAAMIMKMEPVVPFDNDDDREFYDSYSGSRTGALHRLKRKFESLDRRIRRMEDAVTRRDFEWERRIRRH